MIREPVFVVGAERSGTTLLRLMLDHHPEIAFSGEFEFAVDMIGEDGGFPPVEAYREWLVSNRVFRASSVTLDASLDYPRLVNSFLEQRQRRSGKRIVGATVHRHFDRLLYIWPDARFLHIVRDGRDVARSTVRMGWAGNVWTGSERWIEAERLWASLGEKLSESRRCELRYEELVAHPRETLETICGFIGVSFHEAMLSFPDDSTYSFPDAKLAYQWKEKAPGEEIRLAEARIGDLLEQRGYALSGLPRLQVSRRRVARLHFQDRWARRLIRARRFGLPLYLLRILSRRLPFARLDSYVAKRLDEVRLRYIK
jgi:hypothetical protein